MSPVVAECRSYNNNDERGRRDPGGVTGLSPHQHPTWLRSGQSSPACWECPLPRNSSPPAGFPGNEPRVLRPACLDEMTSASTTIPRMAEADRIAEFKEVAELMPDDPVGGSGSQERTSTLSNPRMRRTSSTRLYGLEALGGGRGAPNR